MKNLRLYLFKFKRKIKNDTFEDSFFWLFKDVYELLKNVRQILKNAILHALTTSNLLPKTNLYVNNPRKFFTRNHIHKRIKKKYIIAKLIHLRIVQNLNNNDQNINLCFKGLFKEYWFILIIFNGGKTVFSFELCKKCLLFYHTNY